MNRTAFCSWETDRLLAWDDSSMSSWGADAMEWEANLLLPQLVAALEHPDSLFEESTHESAGRLSSLWRALRTTAHHSTRLSRVLSAN
ncbi:hypothetical protein THL1_2221 [Pseudomonas sp. TCU-HL1]|nr:hypothetical protein THL1_2221 [Pseudomonas sp. TCU-HL1]